MRFHVIVNSALEPVAVRGWCAENEERYEISQQDGKWSCSRVFEFVSDPTDWGFAPVPASDDLFSCMVAAENDAEEREAQMQAQAWEDEEDYR